MKTPNDIKRENSNSGSLGQTYRRRSRLRHISVAFTYKETKDETTGLVTVSYPVDRAASKGTYRNPNRAVLKAERAARKAAKKAA